MMATAETRLLERLPQVRGEIIADAPLAPHAWFRVGGPAEILFRPADVDDLAEFLANRPDDVPVSLLGSGSNVLVRDGGIPGVVIRLGRPFRQFNIVWKGERAEVTVGAGASDITVARACRDAGIGGLEFLSGVPGTIGGALRMNAGAFGREMGDVTISAEALNGAGIRRHLTISDLGFAYRVSATPQDYVFIGATLKGKRGKAEDIAKCISEVEASREASQPLRTRTGGSTFTNPAGTKAWELIDRAGCRGLRRGGAMVSEKHCNFLINTGGASAADLECLGEEVRRRVKRETGIRLEWEIRRLGRHAQELPAEFQGGEL